MKTQILPITLLAIAATSLFGQVPENDAPTFSISYEGNATRFKAQLPPLTQIPGAPLPFYNYHWEFGDGNFSNEESPLYTYREQGSHQVYLATMAAYDDHKNPPGFMASVQAPVGFSPAVTGAVKSVFTKKNDALGMKTNADARPNDEIVVIVSYQNVGTSPTDGQLFVFFNEDGYPEKQFEFRSERTHFKEISNEPGLSFWGIPGADLPGILGLLPENRGNPIMPYLPPKSTEWVDNARKSYKSERGFRFSGLNAGDRRNLFLTLLCTKEMLKDTSAILHLKGIFLPENPAIEAAEFTLEIPVVASHDPNLIAVSDTRINFRHIQGEKLDYRVRFQNNGEGPAKKIQLTVEVPKGLNLGKMKPVDWYPKCPICPKSGPKKGCLDTATIGNRLVFTFQEVYLPGSRQKNLSDRDSTKGFVKYRIEPTKRIAKRDFKSRAEIVFDKNPPISTNFSKTRFKKGFSPGLKAGVSFPPDDLGNRKWFAGASFSPYKSWKIYPQLEVLVGRGSKTETGMQLGPDSVFTVLSDQVELLEIISIKSTASMRTSSLEVPLLLRKNFSRFIGLGIGGSARFIQTKILGTENITTISQEFEVTVDATGKKKYFPITDGVLSTNPKDLNQTNNQTRFTTFADLTLGLVRAGPNLGIRAGGTFDGGFQPFVQASLEVKF